MIDRVFLSFNFFFSHFTFTTYLYYFKSSFSIFNTCSLLYIILLSHTGFHHIYFISLFHTFCLFNNFSLTCLICILLTFQPSPLSTSSNFLIQIFLFSLKIILILLYTHNTVTYFHLQLFCHSSVQHLICLFFTFTILHISFSIFHISHL